MGSSTMKKIIAAEPILEAILDFLKSNLSMCTGAVEVAKVLWAATHPQYWAVVPTIIFVVGTVWVMNGKNYLPKSLPPGSEVIIATALATLFSSYTAYTGGIVGEIPALQGGGISLFNGALQVPVEIRDYKRILLETPIAAQFGGSYLVLFFSACIFAAINVLSIMGIANTFESENGIKWSFKREMCAQGVACAAAGLVGSAPVSGSLSRSLVSRIAGTTSQFACICTGLLWIFCMPYMSIMSPTPKAILSSVIMAAVIKGVCDPKDLKSLKGLDAFEGWATGLATALASPTIGFGFGVVLSIVLSFFRTPQKVKKL
jgi:MFS superfamily sulfate permease-like transporter